MSFWRGKRVTVTGGAGFLGSHLVPRLKELGCQETLVPRRSQYDLREQEAVAQMYEDSRPDIVIHLAAVVGGIGANQRSPGRFFYDNAIMGILLMEGARRFGVKKFVTLGTVCAYPRNTPVPFREEDLWNGYPEETNAPYGLAKKMLLVQAQAYRQEYGFNGITLFPCNLYGPGDDFDLESSHVIPALIRKCFEAREDGQKTVPIWGSGRPTREFLYVRDAVEGIVLATERYDSAEPVNLGSGVEVRISDLAKQIARIVGYTGEFVYDTSRPDGQPKRHLNVSRAKQAFGFEAETPFEEGLRETVERYRQERGAILSKVEDRT